MRKRVLVCVWLMENRETTQKAAAEALGVSLSTVNATVKALERIGAVDVRQRGLRVVDPEKALMWLANMRDVYRDVVYSTRAVAAVGEIEKGMPPGTEFTAFTAYKFKYNDVPADYSEVYVYADEEALGEIKKRFPPRKGPANLFVLEKDGEVTDALVFADLWNLREWYAKEFVGALRDRILE
ncbi:MAG: winged helix-turn-helix domain-containing protein [Candidatus Diapherotrites archaeon]|nr:winged helix-turn-helix domain-containing protein [Candidatus Diapherotrites archaeon]